MVGRGCWGTKGPSKTSLDRRSSEFLSHGFRSMWPGMSEALAHADALSRLAQAQETGPARHGAEPSWASYGGGEAIILTIVLLVAAGLFAFAGKRLRAPLQITRPGRTAA